MNEYCRDDAILTSTTSSILVTQIAALVRRPERFLNIHWLNPAYVIPVVELSTHAGTPMRRWYERVKAVLESIGKVPVVCGAAPGYIVPRLQALDHERGGTHDRRGRRHAPKKSTRRRVMASACVSLRSASSSSSTSAAATSCITRAARCRRRSTADRYAAPPIVGRMVEQGRLGLKSGSGFYDYEGRDLDAYRAGRAVAHARDAQAGGAVAPRGRPDAFPEGDIRECSIPQAPISSSASAPYLGRIARAARTGAGDHAEGRQRLPGRHLLRAQLRALRQEGQRRRQGHRADQLHRRAEGDSDVRAGQCGARRRRRPVEQHDVVPGRHRARRPGAELHEPDDGRDAQERRDRLPEQDLSARRGCTTSRVPAKACSTTSTPTRRSKPPTSAV